MNNEKLNWIIFFGEDWHGHNSTAQYLAKELAADYKILWFNSIGLREPRPTLYDLKRAFNKVVSFFDRKPKTEAPNQSSDTPKNIFIANPLVIPYHRFKLVRKINYLILKRSIKNMQKLHNIDKPIMISANPATADIMDVAKPVTRAYYCADQYSGMPFINADVITKLELDLLKNCDVVIATNKKLQEDKSKHHSNVNYLPHGTNFKHIRQALEKKTTPNDLKPYPKPLIGFVGSIGEHIQLDYIEYAAKNLPQHNFIMVGPVFDGIKPPQAENITYLGSRDYDVIPDYLSNFDVTLMPFVKSERILYAHPTKIREYISAGCITVATPHDELHDLSKFIKIADDKKAFLKQIQLAIKESSGIDRRVISDTMKDHSWSNRAAEFLSYISK